MKRILGTLLAAATLAAATTLLVASPAAASLKTAACPVGTSTISYSPGITNTTATVSESGSESSGACVVLGYSGVSSFTDTFSGTLATSCTEILSGPDSGTQTFNWNDGKHSYWNFTSTSFQQVNGNTVETLTGPITAGSDYFGGGTATQVITYLNVNTNTCNAANPLTTQSGTSTYAITG